MSKRVRVIGAAVAMAAAAAVTTVATAGPAAADVLICEQYGSTTIQGGRYIVQNNRWGASTTQCINVTSTGFQVTQSNHNVSTSGPPAAYPSVVFGCHYANCSAGSGLPALLSSSTVQGLNSSINYTFVTNATYNASYDIWMDPTPRTNGQNTGAEIMIWLNRQGSIQPIGSRIATVNLLGSDWEVWFGNTGWNVISYVRIPSSTSLNFPVMTFVNDSINRGYVQRSWYLTSLQAGFEPWIGGAGLAVNSFSVTNGQPPTTPPTTRATTPPTTRATTPPTTPVTTGNNSGTCTATYRLTGSWQGGFQGEVTVRANSAITGWLVTFTLPSGQTLSQVWGGLNSPSGSTQNVRNESYNGNLAANATTTFGFLGTGSGSGTPSSISCTRT